MKVFVSYARDDEAAVASLVNGLQQARVGIWLDKHLGGGQSWWSEILDEIRSATVFLFALSDKSLTSAPCRTEKEYAQALGLPVLPVQIGEVASYRIDEIFTLHAIDYRQPTAATGLALMQSLRDSADQFDGLPDPMPEPPPIPFEYLIRLGAAIRGRKTLQLDAQRQIVLELRYALREEDEPSAREEARRLLEELRGRKDVLYTVVGDIDATLGTRTKASPKKRAGKESAVPKRDSVEHLLKTEEVDRRTIHYTLDPIIRSLADRIPSTTVLQMVVNTVAALVGPKNVTRACYYELQPGPPRRLIPTTYRAGGESGGKLPTWSSGTGEGDALIEAILQRSTIFVGDTQTKAPWRRRKKYRTFITAPVVAGDVAFGMLTVEAAEPGDLEQRDVGLLTVVAGLTAIAMRDAAGRAGKSH